MNLQPVGGVTALTIAPAPHGGGDESGGLMTSWRGSLTCTNPRRWGHLTVLKERWYERYALWILGLLMFLSLYGLILSLMLLLP